MIKYFNEHKHLFNNAELDYYEYLVHSIFEENTIYKKRMQDLDEMFDKIEKRSNKNERQNNS
jgi:hypothetical protein